MTKTSSAARRKLGLLVASTLALAGVSSPAAEVDWGNNTLGNGLGLADGTLVPAGDLMRIGAFVSLTPAEIAAHQSDLSYLNANFTEFANTTVGAGNPFGAVPATTPDGYWAAQSVNLTATLGIANEQIYYWAFNAPTLAAATEIGIFTDPSVSNWVFPADAAIPNLVTNDLGEVPNTATGIVVGSFGTGMANGFPEYDLEPIPEPSSLLLAAGGLVLGAGCVLRRRARPERGAAV